MSQYAAIGVDTILAEDNLMITILSKESLVFTFQVASVFQAQVTPSQALAGQICFLHLHFSMAHANSAYSVC